MGNLGEFIIDLIFNFLNFLQFFCWLILLHFSYYSIAFRINQITLFLQAKKGSDHTINLNESNQEDGSKNDDEIMSLRSHQLDDGLGKPLELLEKVKMAKSLFQQVVEVSQILNSIFSFPVLVLLIVVVALETLDLFVFICHADFEPILADEMNIANVMSFSFDIAVTYFTLAAADLPVAEVNNLREQVLSISSLSQDPNEKQEIMSFLTALEADRIQLSAGGLFNVGIDLVPSIVGSVATYLIILLQTMPE